MTSFSMTDHGMFSQVCQKEGCSRGAILHVIHELEGDETTWDVCGIHAEELGTNLTALLVRYATYVPGIPDA